MVMEQKNGEVTSFELTPEDFGMRRVPLDALRMENKEASIRNARAVLEGQAEQHLMDLVVLNAGAGIYVGGKAADIAEGVEKARESLRSGAALGVLNKVIAYTEAKQVHRDTGPGPEQP